MLHSRLLRYLDEVARLGSIRKAASRLNVASSAINRQILALESEIGTPIFERMPRRLRLTATGEVLIAHVRDTLKSHQRVAAQIEAFKGLTRGEVTIATMNGLAAGPLPRFLTGVLDRHRQGRLVHPALSVTPGAGRGARPQDRVATRIALMVCIRFSAWSKTTERSDSKTASETSRNSRPWRAWISRPTSVPRSWKAGRQCRKVACGLPVARITWSAGPHEQVAQEFWIPRLKQMMTRAGAGVALAVPATENSGGLPTGNHIMGGMMMGPDPASSVTDAFGRVHGLDNVYVADGSVFVTSGAHNPTNTLMAVALRNMRHLAGTGGPTTG